MPGINCVLTFLCLDMSEMLDIVQPSKFTSAVGNFTEAFAEANIVFVIITSANMLPRGLFPGKIYSQFTILILISRHNYHLQTDITARAREASVLATRNQIYYIFSVVYSSPFPSFT